MANLYVGQAYGKFEEGECIWSFSDSKSKQGIFSQLKDFSIIGDDSGYYIYYFGIQSLPDVRFNINSNKTTAESVIRLGQTGIFELNVFNSTPIEKIKFENLKEKLAENSENYNVNYCLIDVIYEDHRNEGGV